jgi:hypothetical protein
MGARAERAQSLCSFFWGGEGRGGERPRSSAPPPKRREQRVTERVDARTRTRAHTSTRTRTRTDALVAPKHLITIIQILAARAAE